MEKELINWEKLNFVSGWETFQKLQEQNNLTVEDCDNYKRILHDLKSKSSNDLPIIDERLSEIEVAKIFLLNQSPDSEMQFVLEMQIDKMNLNEKKEQDIKKNQYPFPLEQNESQNQRCWATKDFYYNNEGLLIYRETGCQCHPNPICNEHSRHQRVCLK